MRSVIPLLAMIGCCGTVCAQTNETLSAPETAESQTNVEASVNAGDHVATNAPPGTHIYSDSAEIAFDTRTIIYRGHVQLTDPRLNLTCGQLTAVVPEEGDRLDSAIAETNVAMVVVDNKGLTNHVFSDKAVYTYSASPDGTNETVVWTGNPKVKRPDGMLEAKSITYDLTHRVMRMVDQHMSPINTNSIVEPTGQTNAASAEDVELPASDAVDSHE